MNRYHDDFSQNRQHYSYETPKRRRPENEDNKMYLNQKNLTLMIFIFIFTFLPISITLAKKTGWPFYLFFLMFALIEAGVWWLIKYWIEEDDLLMDYSMKQIQYVLFVFFTAFNCLITLSSGIYSNRTFGFPYSFFMLLTWVIIYHRKYFIDYYQKRKNYHEKLQSYIKKRDQYRAQGYDTSEIDRYL